MYYIRVSGTGTHRTCVFMVQSQLVLSTIPVTRNKSVMYSQQAPYAAYIRLVALS